MLTNLENIDIKMLSEVHDPSSQDSFISLYLDLFEGDDRYIAKRKSVCRSILKQDRELLDNFDRTMETVEDYLRRSITEKGQKSLSIFASDRNKFFRAYKLALPLQNMLIADTSPYIRPLAQLMDDYETFGLLLLDQQNARMFIVSSGKVDFRKSKEKDIMNKHRSGGWSQARFQRLRKGAIDHFMKEVAEDAEQLFAKDHILKLVIAGPGSTKVQFRDYLSPKLSGKIVDMIETDFDEADGTLVSRAAALVVKDEKARDAVHVASWREEILKGGLAVYGLADTKAAVVNGQVELLLVSAEHKVKGWKCERCQVVETGTKSACPYCGGEANEIDVIEEIVEYAIRHNTSIDFVESNPMLDELGGIGGLLRYK